MTADYLLIRVENLMLIFVYALVCGSVLTSSIVLITLT
jgi:hypothetical protein